jgi:enoyl-CoA hydratase/carnithine racemase
VELRAINYEVEDGVGLVTLNRPDRLNAWTLRMEQEYAWALFEADADPAVRAVVVTGAGRGFCAGADMKALDRIVEEGDYDAASPPPPQAAELPGRSVHTLPLRLSKPVIAAVNGPAAGVGFVLMCFCDLRFAAAGAKLTTSFGRLGLPAEHGVSWILTRLVGPARAADLLFSSRVVLAEEAQEMGLVNAVMAADELLPFVLDYARGIAREISPSAVAVMKRQLYADLAGPLDAAVETAVAEMKRMVTEPDFKEGTAALAEKRTPRF